MPTGQYDQPGQHQFLNTYVPIPFQEMAGALQQRQRSYEQTAAQRDSTFDALRDVKAHRLDEPAYQEYMRNLDQELSDFQAENPDLSSLEAKTGLNKILRSTSRNKFFRDISANLPVLQQMEQDLATAYAEGRPWDAMDIEATLRDYQGSGGAAGAGQIAPRGLAEATDIIPTLESMGKGFRVEGTDFIFDDATGQYRSREGKVGVSPDQVASAYGMSISDGTLELDYIPEKVYSSPKFATLRNRARFASQNNPDLTYEEAINQEYYQAAAPLVDKYSGYKVSGGTTLTGLGQRMLEKQQLSIDFMRGNVKRFIGDDLDLGPTSKLYKYSGMINDYLMSSPITMTAGLFGRASDALLRGNAEELRQSGLSKEEIGGEFDKARDAALDGLGNYLVDNLGLPEQYRDAALSKLSPFGGAIRATTSLRKVAAEVYLDKFAPKSPSEDYTDIANRIIKESPAKYGNVSDIDQITDEKLRSTLHADVKKAFKHEAKLGFNVPVRAVDPGTQQDMATMIWGPNADNGRVTGEFMSGAGAAMLAFNPEDPQEAYVIGDKVKDKSVVSYVGMVDPTNPYAGGLHEVTIDGQPHWIQVPGINTPKNHPGERRDLKSEAVTNMLHDYNKHIGDSGDWFPIDTNGDGESDTMVRSRVDEYRSIPGGAREAIKAHLEYSPLTDNPGRRGISGAVSTESVDIAELPTLYDGTFYGE